MGESDYSLESTPSWAVAAVCSLLIILALLIEHGLHLLNLYFDRRRRKTLKEAVYIVKTELRNLGFMSMFLTIAKEPISKICMPKSWSNSLLPCKKHAELFFDEDSSCQSNGKVSLVSTVGSGQLQLLIFVLVVFHVFTCLLTFLLGDAKLNKWKSWEEETKTMEFQLSNDPRRFKLTRQTSFGKRHLKSWSAHPFLMWLVCSFRQFVQPVSKADYYALRRGFLTVHFDKDFKFDFQKFLSRSLDHDFAVVVRISPWIWMYAIFMILFSAAELYIHYWPPFIPLLILFVVGMKLGVIITTMCLMGSQETVIVPGAVSVTPDNSLFWFGQPQFLLHLIHFALIQNSFHMAYFTWLWYSFGLKSCFPSENDDIAIVIAIGLLVQFLCAYVTLPLYALVAQMGSSMRESIFADQVIEGLKIWHQTAKRNLEEKRSYILSTPSLASLSNESSASSKRSKSVHGLVCSPLWPTKAKTVKERNTSVPSRPSVEPFSFLTTGESSSPDLSRSIVQDFKFPSGRRELLEVQRVVEEIIQYGPDNLPSSGDISFRLWRKQSTDLVPRIK